MKTKLEVKNQLEVKNRPSMKTKIGITLTTTIRLFLPLVVVYIPAMKGQPPLTLTPVAPKVLKTQAADPSDGASFTATANADGSLSFSLSSAGTVTSTNRPGTRSETGSLKLTPPAGLTGIDANTSLNFVPTANFSGSENLVANSNAGVTWQAVSDSVNCGEVNLPIELFASAAGTPGASFLCRLAVLQVEVVDGTRLAYFDAAVTPHFDYNRDNPAAHTVTTRFYFSLGPALPPPDVGDITQNLPVIFESEQPEGTDTTFVSNFFATGQSPHCVFGSEGPIKIPILITRYVGDVDGSGFLVDPAKLIKNGVISKTAKIRVMAWDVDPPPPTSSSTLPERDLVTLNGKDIGDLLGQAAGSGKGAYLKGFDKQWSMNTFEVPIEILKFPARGTDSTFMDPARNTLEIDADILDPNGKTWCVGIQWASISFDAMAPLMLIHGTNATHTSWLEPIQGTTAVDYLKEQGIPFEYLIDMDPNGSPQKNAKQLDDRVQQIIQQLGVKSVHFIGHSKGGTDSRYLLSSAYGQPLTYQVKSLHALGTPSKGTILSDLVLASQKVNILKGGVPNYRAVSGGKFPGVLVDALAATAATDIANRFYFRYFVDPKAFDQTAGVAPTGEALIQQTLAGMASFNQLVKKRPGTCYYASAGDADLDHNRELSPEESEGMIPGGSSTPDYAKYKLPTETYRFIGRIRSVQLQQNGTVWTATGQITDETDIKGNDMCSRLDTVLCAECGWTTLQTYPAAANPTFPANHTALKSPPVMNRILDEIRADFPLGGKAKDCTP